jgi:hypothetical protein
LEKLAKKTQKFGGKRKKKKGKNLIRTWQSFQRRLKVSWLQILS